MEKSRNQEREKKWCSYHQTSNLIRISSVIIRWERRKKIKNGRQTKWCSLHNGTSHSNQECFQQRSGSKCKDSSTVDGRNSEEH